MKKPYLLTLLIANSFALGIDANVGTLGIGINLKQNIIKNVGIDVGIHNIGINNLNLGDTEQEYRGLKASYKNQISVSNTAYNAGLYYNLIDTQDKGLNIEAGIIYNDYKYKDNQSFNTTLRGFENIPLTGNNFIMNTIAPYLTLNSNINVTNHIYLNSSIGIAKTDINLISIETKKNFLQINYMPILQFGVGYNF